MAFPTLIVQDQKANAVAGGTFTSGAWQTRTLNTEQVDGIGSTLASNQFTLPPGTYVIYVLAPSFAVGRNKAKLRNITDGTDTAMGTNAYSTALAVTHSIIHTQFAIAAGKTFEIQHRCETTRATDGFGAAVGSGYLEVYTQVMVEKVV